MKLTDDIQFLKGVGPQFAKKLNKLGVFTILDLLYYFPSRYEDRTHLQRALDIPLYLEKQILLKGIVLKVTKQTPRPKMVILKVIFQDHQGNQFTAIWFNQPFLEKVLRLGKQFFISGKVVFNTYTHQNEVAVEDYEIINSDLPVEAIVPFYALTEGVYQKKIRQLTKLAINTALEQMADPLPLAIVTEEKLIELRAALKELHYPTERKRWKLAHDRIVFDEFLYVEMSMAMRYGRNKETVKGICFVPDGELLKNYYAALPYTLTNAQNRVIAEILKDMCSIKPMNRMLQGDVGSGKTDVAMVALLCAIQSGYQAVIMVPTAVLAEQHYAKMEHRLSSLGVRVVSLLGKHTPKEKIEIYKRISTGECELIIGTQAIIQEKVNFAKLGFAIIDEQHRFGVVQRQLLKSKSMENIDLLVMTATPIPRTLALTVYGDLDKSIIDELPPGRTPIKTHHVYSSERPKVYEFCRREIAKGFQVFIIYPLVEESEKIDLKAAVESYEYLRTNVFPNIQVGLLHGRMKSIEKATVMNDFREKKTQVLVSTTVIEVGIDIPNATVMVIDNANRFGLAQLHQLRGRVGRGAQKSFCFLIADIKSEDSKKRIRAMVETNDGFKLAEVDLQLRGPGDFVGVRQSGFPDFILADFVKDEALLNKARAIAFLIIEKDPNLISQHHYLLKKELIKRSKGLIDYLLLN